MDAEEFGWWAALYQRDPWGEERADLRNAALMALVASALGKKQYKPADFMPKFGPQPKPKRSLYEQFKAITVAAGGKVTERGG
jgi:hypothetical protein